MRILEYKVNGQRIIPIGNHDGLVAGSKGYLKAKFNFDNSWDGCEKVVSFSSGNKEYAKFLDENDSCIIPYEVLSGKSFNIYVEGRKEEYRIPSRTITEQQIGG